MRNHFARALLATTAALGWASLAQAQDEEAQAAPSDSQVFASEDIIVTATRRAERLQDVPIAVTAVTGEELREAHVDSIAQVRSISPSLTVSTGSNPSSTVNLQIRGIGTNGNSRAFEGAVGVFVDGVYRPKAGQVLKNWLDMSSVEVLRGPQGTLFGRNTSAGAILLSTAKPEIGSTYGVARAQVASFDSQSGSLVGNFSLSDTMAARIAVMAGRTDGYIDNTSNNSSYFTSRDIAGRISLLMQPSDRLEISVVGDFSRSTGKCCYAAVLTQTGVYDSIVNDLSLANGFEPSTIGLGRYDVAINRDPRQRIEDGGVTLKVEYDGDFGLLQTITAYRRFDFQQKNGDVDFAGLDLLWLNHSYDMSTVSQEVSLTKDVDLFQSTTFVLGAYFDHASISSTREVFWGSQAQDFYDARFGPGFISAPEGKFFDEKFPSSNRSFAGFVNATFDLTDSLSLILGGRVTNERRSGAFIAADPALDPANFFVLVGLAPSPEYDDTFKSTAFSGTASVRYRFGPGAMGYATYNRGFKSGGINLDRNAAGGVGNLADPLSTKYKSEYTDSYEVGLKLDYFGGRARTNIAAFMTDISQLQVAQFLGLQFTVVNAPTAKVRGAEIENHFELTDALTFDLAATWLPKKQYGVYAPLGAISGRDFVQSPDWAGSATLAYEQPVGDDLAVSARANLQYRGATYTNTANDARQGAYALLNLGLGIGTIDEGWKVNVFCQNCTDKRYATEHFNTPLLTGEVRAFVGAPRSYGLNVTTSF